MADVNPLVHRYYLADLEKSALAHLRPAPRRAVSAATRAGEATQRILLMLQPASHAPRRES